MRLAEEIGYSRRTIYFMIQNNQVSKRAVERIVEKCAPRVSHADFMPFLFK